MADAPTIEHDEALEEQDTSNKKLEEVHERALKRFSLAVHPQLDLRAEALEARRFVTIPGAQWEGDFADSFENSIKLEIDLVSEGLEKIERDYNENRIVPDFRPAGGKGDQDSADTLDGMHRADSYRFKAQQARDNAFKEGCAGGFGAWRLTTEWEDPYDKENDAQRINPGLIIADADQRVFFDPDDETYDKSKSRYAFILTAKSKESFEDQYDGKLADWPTERLDTVYDWFAPDTVTVAEYYEVEEVDDKIYIFTQTLSGAEQRWWKSELEPEEVADLKAKGWTLKTRSGKRRRIHKYVMSGAEVLKDQGHIAGDRIPIVPFYGKRAFVEGVERFWGHVQKKKDGQRLYNAAVSNASETMAQSAGETPIFAPSQMGENNKLGTLWANRAIDRPAYLLAEPLIDPTTGEIASAAQTGMLPAPQISPAAATILQVARTDLLEGQEEADEVKANVSADAMDIAAQRVDAKSGMYLDNMRQSVECEGEIYLSMGGDIYFEADREVETMTEDGDDGTAKLQEQYTDPKNGVSRIRNDFSRGHYKCVVSVTEATATRRDKTVRSMLNTANVAQAAGDQELGTVAILTAVMNQDGEGISDIQRYARKRLVGMGIVEPTDEEKAEMEAAQQQPDPNSELIAAQVSALEAQATKDGALAEKAGADKMLARAKAIVALIEAGQPVPAMGAEPAQAAPLQ